MEKKLQDVYKTINKDEFPARMEISLSNNDSDKQTLSYEKVEWEIDGDKQGLRYGENPDQKAALYKLVNGNLVLGEVTMIQPGRYLASNIELLQSGKHPGKINITDVDSALNILRYLNNEPATVIVKHNNPCGVSLGSTLAESYSKAYLADRIAAFGGAVVCNRAIDRETAELIADSYSEVVAAVDFEEGAFDILSQKKNLRIMKIGNMDSLSDFAVQRVIDFKSLIDGGVILQWSFEPSAKSSEDFLPAVTDYKGKHYKIENLPNPNQLRDMYFGWMVEAGVTSNSVLFVKDGTTIGIGTGEQDRVGVAQIARDKAYRNYADRLAWLEHKTPFNLLENEEIKLEIQNRTIEAKGGLAGSIMVSDAFFPFKDGAEVGIRESIGGILQPGGSLRDFETIQACNKNKVTMMYTGQRSFRH